MSTSDFSLLSIDELLQRFASTAEIVGNALSFDNEKIKKMLERKDLIQEMQALGAERRRRGSIDRLRELLQSANPHVRGWAGQQFISVDPEWSTAAIIGLFENLNTQEVLAWRERILRGAPPRPSLQEMTVAQLVERFVDACERCYGANRFLMDEQGGGLNRDMYNKASGEIYGIAKELDRRGKLSALVPLLNHPSAAVRSKAGMYCLDIAPQEAVATLEALGDAQRSDESVDAGMALTL